VKNRPLHTLSAAALAITFVTALTHADQIRRRQGPEEVPLEVSLKVGSETYVAKGLGSCTHARNASIYGVVAELWSVRQKHDGRSVQLTLWKPADGTADMFSLSLNAATSTTISTVRGGQVTGSGTVTLAPLPKGGTFTVDAKTRTGEAIAGTIKCEAFTPHIAEGGN
jgi:hypothetical protein